jgi:hypothetical protein
MRHDRPRRWHPLATQRSRDAAVVSTLPSRARWMAVPLVMVPPNLLLKYLLISWRQQPQPGCVGLDALGLIDGPHDTAVSSLPRVGRQRRTISRSPDTQRPEGRHGPKPLLEGPPLSMDTSSELFRIGRFMSPCPGTHRCHPRARDSP